jgi:hypothetical protein
MTPPVPEYVPVTPESDEDSGIGYADPTSWHDQSARILNGIRTVGPPRDEIMGDGAGHFAPALSAPRGPGAERDIS